MRVSNLSAGEQGNRKHKAGYKYSKSTMQPYSSSYIQQKCKALAALIFAMRNGIYENGWDVAPSE